MAIVSKTPGLNVKDLATVVRTSELVPVSKETLRFNDSEKSRLPSIASLVIALTLSCTPA